MTPYLDALVGLVDAEVIAAAKLRVVVDPLFGAGRGYLAGLLGSEAMSVEVVEVNGAEDPSFNGLHPEPIPPWVEVGAREVARLGYDACFVTDGDGDRIGALDGQGNYVSSHRILALLIAHLVEDRDQRGRVVRTQAGSNLLRRQCKRLGLELVTRPIGFKWIYGEMLAGDVLIGGEESGGIGIPTHVRERDGLLAALMLTELMALKGKGLRELVEDMLEELGTLEYARRDLRLTIEQKELLLTTHVKVSPDEHNDASYGELFGHLGEELSSIDRSDGIKFEFSSDAWLLVRPSGTEPLVRVYAEAATTERVAELLDLGCALARAEIALG
jgi:phosphomannomutase